MYINGVAPYKAAILALSICAAGVCFPNAGSAQDSNFTAGDLLEWSDDERNNYYQAAIGMMGAVLAQDQSGYGRCIGNWFFKDQDTQAAAQIELTDLMRQFMEYDPRGIIISLTRKKCGPLPLKSGS